jgi:methylenetetrahydrofolate dehydrogenase (NADP+)/methenyltetrahydrofolate cyclohydrolase
VAARILDGNLIRDQILSEVEQGVAELSAHGARPGLAAVLVGHNPASEIYVRNKVKACARVGIYSETITPPEQITTAELVALVHELNARNDIDGILVQLPLPPQVDSGRVLLAVSPEKDVDGFHPMNVGSGRLHSCRPDRDPAPQRNTDRGPASGRDRPQQRGRQTRGAAAAQ